MTRRTTPTSFPNPIVTGNLYCSRALDEALLRAMVPLRRELNRLGADLWLVRYARGGEHLKIRVHGAPDLEPAVRDLLRQGVDEFLAGIGPALDGAERLVAQDSPPIDDEDRAPEPAPDRSFLFTTYRRSHVSLGGEPFLSDDRYCAAITLALSRGSDLVLDAFASQGEVLSYGQRQRLLIKALLAGIAALRFSGEKAAEYLAYHRDWLVRFPLLQNGGDEQAAVESLTRFEQQAAKAGATIETLRSTTRQWWTGKGFDPAVYPEGAAWGQAITDLYDYVSQFRDDPSYRLDPFSDDPGFTPVFKVFHGLANLLGLKWRDEAFVYHLLIQAAAPEPSRWQRIALTPLAS